MVYKLPLKHSEAPISSFFQVVLSSSSPSLRTSLPRTRRLKHKTVTMLSSSKENSTNIPPMSSSSLKSRGGHLCGCQRELILYQCKEPTKVRFSGDVHTGRVMTLSICSYGMKCQCLWQFNFYVLANFYV